MLCSAQALCLSLCSSRCGATGVAARSQLWPSPRRHGQIESSYMWRYDNGEYKLWSILWRWWGIPPPPPPLDPYLSAAAIVVSPLLLALLSTQRSIYQDRYGAVVAFISSPMIMCISARSVSIEQCPCFWLFTSLTLVAHPPRLVCFSSHVDDPSPLDNTFSCALETLHTSALCCYCCCRCSCCFAAVAASANLLGLPVIGQGTPHLAHCSTNNSRCHLLQKGKIIFRGFKRLQYCAYSTQCLLCTPK